MNRLAVLMRERKEVRNRLYNNACLTSTIIKIDNSSFERVEEFIYDLGTTITNQNSMQEEIKS